MTSDEFNKQNFCVGDRAMYYEDGKTYDVSQIDFEDEMIGLSMYEGEVYWVACEEVEYIPKVYRSNTMAEYFEITVSSQQELEQKFVEAVNLLYNLRKMTILNEVDKKKIDGLKMAEQKADEFIKTIKIEKKNG